MVDGFDVSGLDTPWDDEEEDLTSPGMTQSQRRQTACPGHERALPVDHIVKLLDMKEEGKESLLTLTLQLSTTATVKKVKVKKGIAVCRQACHHRYKNSHTIWDHTVLPATRQR